MCGSQLLSEYRISPETHPGTRAARSVEMTMAETLDAAFPNFQRPQRHEDIQ